jgi:hypothetical protein
MTKKKFRFTIKEIMDAINCTAHHHQGWASVDNGRLVEYLEGLRGVKPKPKQRRPRPNILAR